MGWPSSAFCWACRGLRLQVCWGVVIYKPREKGSLAVGSQASQPHLYSCSPLCSFPSTGTFQFTRSICWLRYDLLSFQTANSAPALATRALEESGIDRARFGRISFQRLLGACSTFLATSGDPRCAVGKEHRIWGTGVGVGVCFPLTLFSWAFGMGTLGCAVLPPL